MKKIIVILFVAVLLPALVFALDKPSSEMTRKVMNYYNDGKGSGAVLVDFELCTEMGKDDATKNDCVQPLSGVDILLEQDVYLWMNFMIPVDDTAQIFVTYSRNSRIRKTQSINLKSAFRYRTWKKIATDKPGQWTIKIFQELGDKDIDLGSMTYMVKE